MSKFEDAVKSSEEIQGAFQSGLQALEQVDRQRIQAENPRSIIGSINIDGHLKTRYPNDPRWDYAIGYKAANSKSVTEKVYWVEVHPATEGEVKFILSKLNWLKTWMATKAKSLSELEGKFVWVASGKTAISPSSPKRRQLAKAGCTLAGGSLRIG